MIGNWSGRTFEEDRLLGTRLIYRLAFRIVDCDVGNVQSAAASDNRGRWMVPARARCLNVEDTRKGGKGGEQDFSGGIARYHDVF